MHRRSRALAVVEPLLPVAGGQWGADGDRVLAELIEHPLDGWTAADLRAAGRAAGVTLERVVELAAEPGFAEAVWDGARRRLLLAMPAIAAAVLRDALEGDEKTATAARKLAVQMVGAGTARGPSTVIQNVNAAAPTMSEEELRRIIGEYETG